MPFSTYLAQLLSDFELAVSQSGVGRTQAGNILQLALADIQKNDLDAAESSLKNFNGQLPAAGLVMLGIIAGLRRDQEVCTTCFTEAVEDTEAEFDVLCLAGDFARHFDFPEIAFKAYDRAIEIAPHASHAHLRRGQAYSETGDVTAAIDDLRRATLLQPNLCKAHTALGDEYRSANMTDAAYKSYQTALEIDPKNADAQSGLDQTLAMVVPQWHSTMLNDTNRNQAFENAISSAVTSGCTVLDLGTGTGLLSMMAAHAGAAHVTGCESVGILADTAERIVRQNGFGDRISVLHKRSQDLVPGEDIQEPANILVAEIVDTGLLGENIIASIADAKKRLCKAEATIIPQGATVYAVPIESEALSNERKVESASGFDISFFNSLRPNMYLQTDLSKYQWQMLSNPVQVFDFDFTQDIPEAHEESYRVTPHTDGVAHGIAFWFDLHLNSEITLSTSPVAPPTHWHQAVYIFSNPPEIKQNEPIRLNASHTGNKITLILES